jgi:UDP-N-acetylmuramate dehydrogenase
MIDKNVSLKQFSNYKIGGNAQYFFEAKTKEELLDCLKEWEELSKSIPEKSKKIFILGGGTNILFADEGFDGLVIKISIKGLRVDEENLIAGAGELVSDVLNFTKENELSGLEWAGGLPGTIGGAVRGNAGAFGGETKDNLFEVESLNIETKEIIKRSNKDCSFSYRSSVFKEKALNEVILFVNFKLVKSNKKAIEDSINEKIEYRKQKHPLEYPNTGSVFKNVSFDLVPDRFREEFLAYVKNDPFPVIPAAKLIFLTDLRGKKIGDVMVSEKHTNFIVNLGNGKSQDVKALINLIKESVKRKYEINLQEEIMYVGGDLNE